MFIKNYNFVDLLFLDRLAKKFASGLRKSDVIALKGDLGSGKTKFTQFLINSFSSSSILVASPTFKIVDIYSCGHLNISHFDLYRVTSIYELYDIGFEDFLSQGPCIIEWPDILQNIIKFNVNLEIYYDNNNSTMRNIDVHCDKYWYNVLN